MFYCDPFQLAFSHLFCKLKMLQLFTIDCKFFARSVPQNEFSNKVKNVKHSFRYHINSARRTLSIEFNLPDDINGVIMDYLKELYQEELETYIMATRASLRVRDEIQLMQQWYSFLAPGGCSYPWQRKESLHPSPYSILGILKANRNGRVQLTMDGYNVHCMMIMERII